MKYLKSLTSLSAYQSLRKTSVIISGWLCTAGGLVADVLQPIAPFAFYIFVLSLAGLILLSVLYAFGKKELLGALILSGISTLATGAFSLMQQGEESSERGIVATTVPAVATLQSKLGIIEEKLDDIKQDTETIKSTTSRIDAKSDAMIESLDAIKEGFGNLKTDGVIKNPSSPEEHYHNARIHELEGDYAAARRSYMEYFKSDLPKLDPHLRFISFLKVQEGTAGAREMYNQVTARSYSGIPTYARLLLLPADKRKQGLEDYWNKNPNFAPAAYHLSLEFSELRLGSQTIADQRAELSYIESFQKADETGGLLRYLIDQELAREWREDVDNRKRAIEKSIDLSVLKNPVSISWMAHNSGWNANIQISETARDIFWNIKGQTSPQSVGLSDYIDPSTGNPMPRSFFSLPNSQNDAIIEISYDDRSGTKHGPYEFQFTVQKESDDGNRKLLEMTTTSWVSFNDYDGQTLLYFSHLLVYRGALSKIEYGINEESPNQNFDFPAWNGASFATIDENVPTLIKVPADTVFATVQLTYKSGEKSAIVRFERPL